ncbi:MAG: hypothetical protein RMJ98_18085 [Myxococcales bacterium]|nr:hypothetical protein [Polyangiaceae bacterium]MDW8251208.1 hypothetical protein [Myxococcales bacterium]
MRARSHLLPPSLLVLALALLACGTPGASGPGAKGASDPPMGVSEASGTPAGASSKPAAPKGPQGPSCEDGSCFVCGDGICPAGFYCQKSGGVTGCAWAVECTPKPSCSCIGPLTRGCSCEERSGFPHVICGS